MARIKIAGRTVGLPGQRWLRVGLGLLFIAGGLLWFLPVLGLWMLPVGFGILAVDFAPARRFYRRNTIRLGYLLHTRWPRLARFFGYGTPRTGKH